MTPVHSPFRAVIRATLLLAFASTLSCSGDASSTTPAPVAPPPPPPPPAPVLVLGVDSVAANAISGAAVLTRDVDITSGTATAASALAIGTIATPAGQPAPWVTASLSAATTPAKLTVSISPTTLTAGRYEAVVNISATNTASKSVRVALVVAPRPRLVVEQSAVSLSAELGGTLAPQTINISSVDGAIEGLTVSAPDCGTGPSTWPIATLAATTAPTTLKIAIAPEKLIAGSYSCAFVVSTKQPLVDSASQTVRVSLTMRAVPRIGLATDSVAALVFRTADASPIDIGITNSGSGTLSGLSLGTVSYDNNVSGWLTARLDSSTAPTTLRLAASAKLIPAGAYTAVVPIVSSATDVANSPRSVKMVFTVAPRPSSLIVVPSAVTITRKQGSTGSNSLTVSVTHSGDLPLQGMGFANPAFAYTYPFQVTLGCTGLAFETPCTGQILLDATPSLPVGTYSAFVSYYAYYVKQTATLSITIKVVP